jgi:hypothetical protein
LPRYSATSPAGSRYRPAAKGAGGPFAALLLENDLQRESAVAALLAGMERTDTRLIRVVHKAGMPLTLGRILLQAMAPGGVVPAVDDPRLLVAAIVEPQRPAARVLLLIEQAERIHPDALRSLVAMAPYFAAAGQPSLRVVFVGRPSFRDLLQREELLPLRQALRQSSGVPGDTAAPAAPARASSRDTAPLPPASGLFEPTAARAVPRRWPIAGLAIIMLTAAYYVGLREPRHVAPAPSSPAPPADHAAPPAQPAPTPAHAPPLETSGVPAPAISPVVQPLQPPPASPPPVAATPAPSQASAVSRPANPPRAAGGGPGRLWDFDAFLLDSGRNPASLSEPERSGLFDEFLRTRERPAPRASSPVPSGPRIVVHVPAGSASAEALSGRLLGSLGGHSGTVEERHVAETPSQPSIRYFHPEDAPTARRAADWMAGAGLSWTVRDFTSYQPRPSRGTIEVWVPRQP